MTTHEPDEEPVDPGALAAFERVLEAQAALDDHAIELIYGSLPSWFPEPAHSQIEQALSLLRNDGQSPEDIARLVQRASADDYEIPGVRDPTAFVFALDELAHVQWALSQDKGKALEELGGSLAAKTYKWLRRGKDEQDASAVPLRNQRNQKIQERAAALRKQHPGWTAHAIATYLASDFSLSAKQIERILRASTSVRST